MNPYSILALSILMMCVERGKSQSHGDLRLVQQDILNASFTAGRLEIFLNSNWGSICSDNFDMIAADVACRQLGYFGALEVETSFHTPYGRGVEGPVWLDEVSCDDADLLHILSCSHVGLQENDCNHFSDVAVKCTEQGLAHPNDMDVRIVGGNFKSQGLLEVHCNGIWAPVCPPQGSQFGKAEGDAACRQLGYTESVHLWTSSSSELTEETTFYTQELKCLEGAQSIASCKGTCEGVSNGSSAPFQTSSCVFIQCTHSVPYGSLRLSQGSLATPGALEGRLEIFYDGKWGTVCSEGFDLTAANVSCRQLGFAEALNYTTSVESDFGEGSTESGSLGGVRCTPEDSTLIQCANNREKRNCTLSEDVALFCTNFSPEPPTGRLDKDEYIFSLEIFIAAAAGSGLFFIMFSVCLAVYKVHFSLVPYDTMKERSTHGLYFTEYEGSSFKLDEASLEQKLSESTAKEGKSKQKDAGKCDVDSSEQPPQRKKRYITMKTKSSSPSSMPEPAVNNHHSKSSSQPHAQSSLVSSKADTSPNTALPAATSIPHSRVVKKKTKQEKISSKKNPGSKSPLKDATSLQLTLDGPTLPEADHITSQGSFRTSKSKGNGQRLSPPKPEPYKGIRSQTNQPEMKAPKSTDGNTRPPIKPEPYKGMREMYDTEIKASDPSGSDKALPPVETEPHSDLRKVTVHPKTIASEGVNNFDDSLLGLSPRQYSYQYPTLDTIVALDSSAGTPVTHANNDTHHVSFKLE